MMRATSTAATRRPSSTRALRNPRILCTPRPRASAAARRAPALKPYTPPVTQRGSVGVPPTARTASRCGLVSLGESLTAYGVLQRPACAAFCIVLPVALLLLLLSSARITVCSIPHNNLPPEP